MTQSAETVFIEVREVLGGNLPSFLPLPSSRADLDRSWAEPLTIVSDGERLALRTAFYSELDISFHLLGLDALAISFREDGITLIDLEFEILPRLRVTVASQYLGLRFRQDLLRPVRRVDSGPDSDSTGGWELDPQQGHAQIQLSDVSLTIDENGDISLEAEGPVSLSPMMIGETGVVVEAKDLSLHLDATSPPSGQPPGWRGVSIASAALYLPGELGEIVGALELSGATIGHGGFSGETSRTLTPPVAGRLLGLDFEIHRAQVGFIQNTMTASSLRGRITLPFFDRPLDVEIAISLDGAFSVRLADDAGLRTLELENTLRLVVESLSFEVEDGRLKTLVSGKLEPLLGQEQGLDWPTFEVRELSIDSEGNVHLAGGWLDLRQAYTLDFFGFQLEITRLGFGRSDERGRWVGFSGSLKLVEGLPAGASVEGLRITWYDDQRPASISFDGVGVELTIPNVLRFRGEVSYRQLQKSDETVHRFDGAVRLELLALGVMIDGNLVIGHAREQGGGSYTFLAIYLGLDLPAGLPLWATGLALYGIAGLYAQQMEPGRKPDEPWYGVGPQEGWYKRDPFGVTGLEKWTNRRGSLALGAGVTIGTLPDNGFTFASRLLLAIVFPGPILLLEGKANLLKRRSALDEEPLFRALLVLDFRAGSLLAGLDARYRFGPGGRLIDIHGSAEAFFDFDDAQAWHLYLGQDEPLERRIRARMLSLWQGSCYLMLDPESLRTGARISWGDGWKFGPVRFTLEAWLETNARVNWQPAHFYGELLAHGKVELKVFGFGLGLSVDALIAADVFDPFHLLGAFDVTVKLPCLLPNVGVSVTLEWGPEESWPALPLPLREVAIEHFKVTTSWPLPRSAGLLLPNLDRGDGLLNSENQADARLQPPPPHLPVVPLDCRPHLTFSRPIHDDALVGVNAMPVMPEFERIGDPERDTGPVKMRFGLQGLSLAKWTGDSWQAVAIKEVPEAGVLTTVVPELFGSWAPVPQMPDGGGDNPGQVKLRLWSRNPFDYARHAGNEWDEWFTGRFRDYPCVEIPELEELCWTFTEMPVNAIFWQDLLSIISWLHPGGSVLLMVGLRPLFLGSLEPSLGGAEVGLCAQAHESQGFNNLIYVFLPEEPNRGVRIDCRVDQGFVLALAESRSGDWSFVVGGTATEPSIEIDAPDIRTVILLWFSAVTFGTLCIGRWCILRGPTPEEIAQREIMARHLVESLQLWQHQGHVLEPATTYRLEVGTRVEAIGEAPLTGSRDHQLTEFVYFRTEGPPGLADLSIPLGAENPGEIALRDALGHFLSIDGSPSAEPVLASQLNDLQAYVRQTLPATVPERGQRATLRRPVYRAYDIAIEFNEDYVGLMYRLAGRDLGLYLFDVNGQPARDIEDRLLVPRGRWGRTDDLALDRAEETWLSTLDAGSCASLDRGSIRRDETLTITGMVLEPDSLYEARLLPLLAHEDFADKRLYTVGDEARGTGSRLGRWIVEDRGDNGGESHWVVAEGSVLAARVVQQLSNHWGGDESRRQVAKPGTTLWLAPRDELPADHPDQPRNWTDYRLSLLARSTDDDAWGVVFRRRSGGRHYRFSLDRERRYRRLVRVGGGRSTVLAEDYFVYQIDRDYEVVIEAIGIRLTVFLDGERIFEVEDGGVDCGGIGLYCWANEGMSFADVRVEDLRPTARPVYRFQFATSRYAHFEHQIHSYQHHSWLHTVDDACIDLLGADTGTPEATPSVDEQRRWRALEASPSLDQLLRAAPTEFEVTRLADSQQTTRALLVRSPEPIDWARTTIALSLAGERGVPSSPPDDLKLLSVRRHPTDPSRESVTLLVRQPVDPSGASIDLLRFLGPGAGADDGEVLFEDRFVGDATVHGDPGRLVRLGAWEIRDAGSVGGPSRWRLADGSLSQTSRLRSPAGSGLGEPGAFALAGEPWWRDYRLQLRLRSETSGSIGALIRYQDEENFYRFTMDRRKRRRRLVACVEGRYRLLWEDSARYRRGREYLLTLECLGARLAAHLDAEKLFEVSDPAGLDSGRAGLYCHRNHGAHFLEVRATEATWIPYYRFDIERTLAAGTRIEVFSASGANSELKPMTLRRFVASPSERGRLHLPPGFVELRLTLPDRLETRRSFLPDADFTPVATRALRKVDGTAFALVPENEGWPDAIFRLSFTYRRQVTGLETLSLNGDSGSETAWIDIP